MAADAVARPLNEPEKAEFRQIINDLSFERIVQVDAADEFPLSGVATFRGVPYTFRRIPHTEIWPDRSQLEKPCFELCPIDPDSGLVMWAIGTFRSSSERRLSPSWTADPESQEVRWTALGAVGLNGDPDLRRRFSDFLDRLSNGTATSAHRQAFAVNHYFDELVEDIRRDCVHLFYGRSTDAPVSDFEQKQLRQWADRLRISNS